MKNKFRSYCFIILAAVMWGCVGIFVNELHAAGLSSMQIVAVRVTIATVFYLLFLAATDRKSLKIAVRDIWMFLCTGIVSFAFFNWCYFNAMEESSLGVAAVLLYTSPAIIAVLSVFVFHERLTLMKVIAVLATFAGCVLVTGVLATRTMTLPALLYGLGAGLGYALYTVFSKIALQKYNNKTVCLYTFLFASAAAIPLAGFDAPTLGLLLDGRTALLALAITTLGCVLPYALYTAGLSNIETGVTAILSTIEPVVAAVVGVLLYHEGMSGAKAAGILLIVAAVAVQSLGSLRKRTPAAPEETAAPRG